MNVSRFAVSVAIFFCAAALCSGPAAATTFTFTNAGGTCNWNSPANWNLFFFLPGSADDVVIPNVGCAAVLIEPNVSVRSITIQNGAIVRIRPGYTLTISNASTINSGGSLQLNNSNISGAGALTVNGLLDHWGGTIGGTGTLTINTGGGKMRLLASAGSSILSRTTFNDGEIEFLDTRAGAHIFGINSPINNTGSIAIQNDELIQNTGSGSITNSSDALLVKNAGGGIATIQFAVNNASTTTVSSTSGTLALSGGGTQSGAWSISPGATIQLTGGTFTAATGSPTASGGGTLSIAGATLDIGDGAGGGTASLISSTPISFTSGTINLKDANLQTSSSLSISATLNHYGGSLTGGGTMTINAGGVVNFYGTMSSANLALATITNYGTIDIQADPNLDHVGGSTTDKIINKTGGTIRKSAGSGTSAINMTIDNSGTLRAASGTLSLGGGLTFTSGTIDIASGAKLAITGGTAQFNGVATMPGAGTFVVSGGTLRIPASVTQTIARLTLQSGTIDGAGTLVLDGTSTWSGGTMGSATASGGTTRIDSGDTLNISGSGLSLANGRTLLNNGSVNLSGSTDIGGTATFNNAGTLTQSGSPGTISPVFNNSGTVTISSGTLNLNGGGTHTGTFNATGTLSLSSAHTFNAPATIGGTGTLAITGGVSTINVNATVASLNLSAGTLTGSGTVTVNGGTWFGGTMGGSGTTNIAAGASFSAGTVTLDRTLDNDGTLTVNGTVGGSGTIRNDGTVHAGIAVIAPAFDNHGQADTSATLELSGGGTHSGTFTATAPGSIVFSGGTHTLTGSFNGTGTLTASGGTLLVNTDLSIGALALTGATLGGTGNLTIAGNSTWSGGSMTGPGTTSVNPGVTLSINGAATLARALVNYGTLNTSDVTLSASGGSLANNGTLQKTSGAGTMLIGAPVTNTGLVQVTAGTLQFTDAYTQTAGTTNVGTGATLQAATLELDGGLLTGQGTVAGNLNNDAVVAPGASPGVLTVDGSYTQSASGTLNVEIGGTNASQYDQLHVTGSVTLDGTLNVQPFNGFSPSNGNTFQILTYGSRPGSTTFATMNGVSLGSGTSLNPAWNANDLTLVTNVIQSDVATFADVSSPAVPDGEAFTYTILITNHGGSNATGVTLAASLPPNVIFNSASPAICTGAPNLVCAIGNLANQTTYTLTLHVTANGGGSAPLSVSASASEYDSNLGNNHSNTATTITTADLAITIDGPASAVAGTTAVYTIVVTNNGPDSASGAGISVVPAASLSFAESSGACSGFPCSLGTLAPGASATITSSWNVAPAATTPAQLTANVSALSPPDPASNNNSATATTPITRNSDVEVTKSGPATVPPESATPIAYDIAVTNHGPSTATNVQLADPTPAGLSFVSASGACTTFPCSLGTLAPGQTKNVQASFTVSGAGTAVTNTATVTSSDDANAANDSSSATTTIGSCPTVAITHPANADSNAAGNVASVPLFTGATYAWTITNGTITSGAGTSEITFTAGPTGSVGLAVTVTAGACTSNPTASISILDADLAIDIDGPASAVAGTTAVYTIVVTNDGTDPATGVSVSGAPGASLAFTSNSGACTTAFPCSLGTLAAGRSVTITSSWSIDPTATATSTQLAATVSASSPPDPASNNNSATATTSITRNGDLEVVKSGPATVPPESTASITYTIVVTNKGPSTSTNAQLSDPAPAGLSFVSASGACTAFPCSLGTLAPGDTRNVQASFTVSGAGTAVTNTATATSSDDANAANNSSSVTTSIGSCPTVAITHPAAVDGSSSGNTASVPLFTGATYAWTITNGTIASGASTHAITFTAGATGSVELAVTVTVGACTSSPTASVPIAERECPTTAPQLTAPQPNATVVSPVTFSWNAVPGATSYALFVGENGSALKQIGVTSNPSLRAALIAGPATWRVDAMFHNCPAVASAVPAFTVQPPCEGTASPLSPADGTTTSNAQTTFEWTAVAGSAGYRVWLQSVSEAAQVLATTLGTSHTEVIGTGTYSWWIETLFAGCASRESAHRALTITPAQNCSGAAPALVSPPNETTTTTASVVFMWNAVAGAIEYELWLSSAGGVPTLNHTTPQTSHTIALGPGRYEWFVRAVFAGCPATQSDSRAIAYEPPPACADDTRAVLIAPYEGERLESPLSFDWSDVAGATSYDLIVDGERIATTTASQASSLDHPAGEGRWLVRAHFAPPCSPLDSSESRFTVVDPPPACEPLEAPAIAAPGQISTGISTLIQWSAVPGATEYLFEHAATPAFDAASTESQLVVNRQFTLELENDTAAPLARYLRVHAVNADCAPPVIGPLSAVAVMYVLPKQGSEGSVPINDPQLVEYELPIAKEFAGLTFTATPTATWIRVQPASGIVPADGLTILAIVNPSTLPPGTSIGGVTIRTANALLSGHGSSSTSTTFPISVNLVSPVTPTPPSTPPPDALIIPAVASAQGINAQFQSDVRVSNTSAQVMKYLLTFTPSGDAGITAGRQTTFSIEPGQTIALDAILKTWFGTGGDNASGMLEVRPLTVVAKSTSSAAVGALANLVTFASSRTFNVTPDGTFGQFIPAIPFANFIGRGSLLSLQQIAQSEKFRTNVGFVEGSGKPVSLVARIFGASGQLMEQVPVSLNGGQHTQLNAFLAQNGIASLADGRVEVEVASGDGKVTAYASVLDNETGDPLFVSPVTLNQSGNTKWVLPGVADLDTGGANWQTDVRLFNAGTAPAELTLTFHSMNGGAPKTVKRTVAPGEVQTLDRVLSLFGVVQDGGAMHIDSTAASRLIVTARTYNATAHGSYGQFISAVTPAEAVGVGSRPLQLLQLEQSERYRSNIGFFEVTGKPVTLEVSVILPQSKTTPVVTLQLKPNEFRQLTSMLAAFGLGDIYNARVAVRAIAGEGRAATYASVIDLKTNDPTYVPGQ